MVIGEGRRSYKALTREGSKPENGRLSDRRAMLVDLPSGFLQRFWDAHATVNQSQEFQDENLNPDLVREALHYHDARQVLRTA